MTVSEIATVLAWHDALNAQELDTLVELSTGDIEIGDAHGAVQGHRALREWATSKGFLIEPGRMYVHDGVVVVEQHIGDAGSPQVMASAFRVVHDKVASVFSHDDLETALAATDLSEDDIFVG
ncbi:MAG: nuclear transport factor 2 family protein [Candidatus Sericytochromatia bacterium]